jgi:hypothetical protein
MECKMTEFTCSSIGICRGNRDGYKSSQYFFATFAENKIIN